MSQGSTNRLKQGMILAPVGLNSLTLVSPFKKKLWKENAWKPTVLRNPSHNKLQPSVNAKGLPITLTLCQLAFICIPFQPGPYAFVQRINCSYGYYLKQHQKFFVVVVGLFFFFVGWMLMQLHFNTFCACVFCFKSNLEATLPIVAAQTALRPSMMCSS